MSSIDACWLRNTLVVIVTAEGIIIVTFKYIRMFPMVVGLRIRLYKT